MHKHEHGCEHHHGADVSPKTIVYLLWSFIINIVLSAVELVAGIVGGSVALIGDALHNTSDAFSILIAILAYKIGLKKANKHFTYGFKRAETIGAFVNLILLFVSAGYLLIEGITKLVKPEQINGQLIIYVSVLALIIDALTAKLSHQHSHHNTNIKMLFLHNLADAFGSLGVIISGFCVIYFNWYFVDGIVALLIAGYMIFHAVSAFPKIVKLLMNATPDNIDIEKIKQKILRIKNIKDVHHIHLWNVSEGVVSLECHVVSNDIGAAAKVQKLLAEKFDIKHSNVQIENDCNNCQKCCL